MKHAVAGQACPPSDLELYAAKFRAMSRNVFLVYGTLCINCWILVVALDKAEPTAWLIVPALVITLTGAARTLMWRRQRNTYAADGVAARRQLRWSIPFTALWSVFLVVWARVLLQNADAGTRAYVAFFLGLTILGCVFGLLHDRNALMILTVIAGIPDVVYFVTLGSRVEVAMGASLGVALAGAVWVALGQNRAFALRLAAERKAQEGAARQHALNQMVDDMPYAVVTLDPETLTLDYLNKASLAQLKSLESLLPVTADDVLGASLNLFTFVPEDDRQRLADPQRLPHTTRVQLGSEVLELAMAAITDLDGSFLGPMVVWSIITKEVEAEERINKLARYDSLTGLPNRRSFTDRLDTALADSSPEFTLMMVDLDGFKNVNDVQGHAAGDAVLVQVADRLRAVCERAGAPVGRLGGDEFAVLLPRGEVEPFQFAEELIATVSEPYVFDHTGRAWIGASAGIAGAPEHGEDAETLMRNVDAALYAAKAAGKGAHRMFSADMLAKAAERGRMEAALHDVLESQDGLFVFFQPIVNVDSGSVTAREALVRWHHSEFGWVPPIQFVALAEECGVIDELGALVLSRACREAAEWQDEARLAVNVSGSQLGKGTLVPLVIEALAASGLPAARLELEVTETAILKSEHAAIAELVELRTLGVRVALDDFGTGYSSLAHISKIAFDSIKIDGSFVREALHRPESAAVVKAVAELGSRLGVTTIAEGVETPEQLSHIQQEGCIEVQGYLFGRPVPTGKDAATVEALNNAMLGRADEAASFETAAA